MMQAGARLVFKINSILGLHMVLFSYFFLFHRIVLHRSGSLFVGFRRPNTCIYPSWAQVIPATEVAPLFTVLAPAPVFVNNDISYVFDITYGNGNKSLIRGYTTAILVTVVYWILLSSSATFSTQFSCEFRL